MHSNPSHPSIKPDVLAREWTLARGFLHRHGIAAHAADGIIVEAIQSAAQSFDADRGLTPLRHLRCAIVYGAVGASDATARDFRGRRDDAAGRAPAQLRKMGVPAVVSEELWDEVFLEAYYLHNPMRGRGFNSWLRFQLRCAGARYLERCRTEQVVAGQVPWTRGTSTTPYESLTALSVGGWSQMVDHFEALPPAQQEAAVLRAAPDFVSWADEGRRKHPCAAGAANQEAVRLRQSFARARKKLSAIFNEAMAC